MTGTEVDPVVFSPWQLVSHQENKKRERISPSAKPFDTIIMLGQHNTKINKTCDHKVKVYYIMVAKP